MTAQDVISQMVSRFDAAKAAGVEAEVQLNLSGEGGGAWFVSIKDGKAAVSQGAASKPVATVDVAAKDWVDISLGKLDPMMAFMTGKVKVSGDIGFMMKFQGLFQRGS